MSSNSRNAKHLILALALCVTPFAATGSDKQCPRRILRAEEAVETCRCGSALAELPISAPTGMRLVAACRVERHNDSYLGHFYFTGETTLKGKVTRHLNDVLGDIVWFSAEPRLEYTEFASALNSLRWDNPADAASFEAPEPTPQRLCWEAQATIIVRAVFVSSGWGTDEEGSFPTSFSVSNVGEFSKCAE